MCVKEEIRNTFKHKLALGNGKRRYNSFTINQWWNSFSTMMSMVSTQATGVIKIINNYF